MIRNILAAALVLCTMNACAQPAITGTAFYRERMQLPPEAVFEATLEDISRADVKAEVIGRARVDPAGAPPFSFEIPYDPGLIDPRNSYAVRGRVLVDDRLMFTTDQVYPVLTRGYGNEVELLLKRVASDMTTSDPVLQGPTWQLTELQGRPVEIGDPQRRPELRLDAETERAAGSGGCNRFSGAYRLAGQTVELGPLASTRRACAEGMELEQDFFTALDQVSGWRIRDAVLELLDDNEMVLMRFVAVPEGETE